MSKADNSAANNSSAGGHMVQLAPYCLVLALIPLGAAAAIYGGWWLLVLYAVSIVVPSTLDILRPLNLENPDTSTAPDTLVLHRALLMAWPFLQGVLIFGAIAAVTRYRDVAGWEAVLLFVVLGGSITGMVGPVVAHELIHRNGGSERLLGDALLGQMFYGHFRTEHIFVHHRYVATPRDTVTARYRENLYRFLARGIPGSLASAFCIEADRQRHRGRPVWGPGNPFWIYAGFAAFYLVLAWLIGGWAGIGLFAVQAGIAILYLEIINYIEHYGLERRLLPNGRFEPVKPHHSWNSAHRFTNYLLFNLPRHPDHHYKPDRIYPLLQTYPAAQAPQMPWPYPVMFVAALFPPIWMRMMNKRVRRWRARYYPEIKDWPAWGTSPAAASEAQSLAD
jgi:alkane 1-monooxygenase